MPFFVVLHHFCHSVCVCVCVCASWCVGALVPISTGVPTLGLSIPHVPISFVVTLGLECKIVLV